MRRILVLLAFVLLPCGAVAQSPEPGEEYLRARVERIEQAAGEEGRVVQLLTARILAGSDEGETISVENAVLDGRDDMRLAEGETVVLRKITKVDGSVSYAVSERYRLPGVLLLCAVFALLAIALGGKRGLSSLLGLAVSVLILALYVVPTIARGGNPMLVSVVGSAAIACTSLYLAHGFSRRTSVALLSTLATLAVAAGLAVGFVTVGKLFGMGTEESMYLQTGALSVVNLRGLLLGGIVIGCLGVLDDITTAQTAVVDELRRANRSLGARRLWLAGMSVGREHIASLINTLALAYAGAALPLLLLFTANEGVPLWVTLNSEFLAEEIVRTLVGSSALLFAVPISTWFAVRFLGEPGPSAPGHGRHAH